MTGERGDCEELVRALAWMLALALVPDPERDAPEIETEPAAPESAEPAPQSAPPAPPVVVIAPPMPSKPLPSTGSRFVPVLPSQSRVAIVGGRRVVARSTSGYFQIAGGVSGLDLPAEIGPMVALGGGLTFDRTFEIRLDFTWLPIQGRDVASETARGHVEATLFDIRLSGCLLHEAFVGGCVVLAGGAVSSWLDDNPGHLAPIVRLGARGVLRWPWNDIAGAALEVDGGALLVRPELAAGDQVLWSSSAGYLQGVVAIFVRIR
jgi:hypothetical protein